MWGRIGIRKFRNLFIIVAIVLAVCLSIGAGTYMYIGSQISGRTYEPELVIASPDGQCELVIRAFSCLGGAGAELYIRNPGQDKWYNRWMKTKIGTVGTDDYYQPFTNGAYEVEWETDHITVYYCKGVPAENKNDPATWRGVLTYHLIPKM